MKIKCCYECTERALGCHATCEKYIAERKALDEEKQEKRNRQEKRNMIWETYLRGLKNMKNVRAHYNEKRKRK